MADDALLTRLVAAVDGQYAVEAEVGRGGMAVVYRATDVRLRRKVALKVLPPELAFREEVKRRFLREAEMAAGLSHPHIVPIYAVMLPERHRLPKVRACIDWWQAWLASRQAPQEPPRAGLQQRVQQPTAAGKG